MNQHANASTLAVGDLVWGRPWADGTQAVRRRKGLIVRRLSDTTVLVWWYGAGAPKAGSTAQAMFPNELTRAGSFAGASIRQLREWERGLGRSDEAWVPETRDLGHRMHRLHTRLRAAATN